MKKCFYILLVAITAIAVLVPPQLFAGVSKPEKVKTCCMAKMHGKMKGDCCKKQADNKKGHCNKKDNQHNCGKEGCCCTTQATNTTVSAIALPAVNAEKIIYTSTIQYTTTWMQFALSRGFGDIWQPPKI